MKVRLIVTVAVLTVLSAIAGAGSIDARSAAEPTNDFVLAWFNDHGTQYFINASSGPAGGKADGAFATSIPWLKGKVRCLAVHRHEALVIADNRAGYFVVTLLVRDNNPGPDELLFADLRQGRRPRHCPPFDGTDGYPGTPVSGDIRVHDAEGPLGP